MEKSNELGELVAFFSSSVVETLIERYNYTEEEEQKIKRAIREANSKEPNVILLRQANTIMNNTAKTQQHNFIREPTEAEEKLLKMPSLFASNSDEMEDKSFISSKWLLRAIFLGTALLVVNYMIKLAQPN